MTMIEKVARASFECWRKLMDDLGHHKDRVRTFEDMGASEREFAFMNARAMIEAMKEPTEEIIEAMKRAGTAQNVSVESIQRGVAVRVTPLWEAAINVALAEEPSPR